MSALRERVGSLRVLSVGHVTHDRYGDDIVPGGCAFFGAKTCAGLGARTRLLTAVGDDFQCHEALADLETSIRTGGATTVFTNTYPPGGLRVQLVEAQAPMLEPDQLPASWCQPDVFFLAPVMGEIIAVDWATRVDATFTALALQGFLKEGAGDALGSRQVVKRASSLQDALFEHVDAVFLSEEDLALFGYPELLETLRSLVKLVVVTQGEEGSLLYFGEVCEEIGVYSVEAVDPTGAGDSFAAATTLGLASGLPPRRAALLGAAAASVVVEARGGEGLSCIFQAYGRYDRLI